MYVLTAEMLRQIMPNLKRQDAEMFAPLLTDAMDRFGIDTWDEVTMFIANLAHESGEFRWMEEIASGAAYEGRKDLGNTEPGDGKRFKGHGPIQITGRTNHLLMGMLLDLDLIAEPLLLTQPKPGVDAAAAFWWNNRLDDKAKVGFIPVVKAINGGTNGLADRKEYLARAQKVIPVQL